MDNLIRREDALKLIMRYEPDFVIRLKLCEEFQKLRSSSTNVSKRYINQLTTVWDDLYNEAQNAMCYVDCDNECNEKYLKVLDKLQDRFDKTIAHFE